MAARDRARLAIALAIGAAIAFPLGMIAGGGGGDASQIGQFVSDAPARQVFSPSVAGDPHFLSRQREGTELLEQQCRDTGAYCAEAAQMRRWLNEQQQER